MSYHPSPEQVDILMRMGERFAKNQRKRKAEGARVRDIEIQRLKDYNKSPEGQRINAEKMRQQTTRKREGKRKNTSREGDNSAMISKRALAMIAEGICREDIAKALGFKTFEAVRYHLPENYSSHSLGAKASVISDADLERMSARMAAGERVVLLAKELGVSDSTLRKKVYRWRKRQL